MSTGGLIYADAYAETLDVPPDNLPRGSSSVCGNCRSRQPVIEVVDFFGGVEYRQRIEQKDRRCDECPTRATDAVPLDFSPPEPPKQRRWRRK